ncbi:MAG: toxin-antitoxin system protein [Thiotrichaceae bacterium]|nr:MAG: toxin-antitoxin system protein [Thiotrichaceae bacterium]
MSTSQNKIAPINIRALEGQRALIDKAASSLNKTRSDFMLEVACQAAKNILLDQRLFLIDEDTFNAFQAQLDAPVADNEKLHYLLNQKSPWDS